MNKGLAMTNHFAFNIWDFNSARTVIDCAAKLHQDVILQTSVGVYKELPSSIFSAFVHSYAKRQRISAWLNIDHCRDINLCKSAVDSGWDMVMIDMSAKSLDENIELTNEITEYAHKFGCLVEAEVGQVKGIEDDISVRDSFVASKRDIQYFVEHTNIDFIAVAFGNAHGEYKTPPILDYELVEFTIQNFGIPFVVHGGSGMTDEIILHLINLNVKKINISTELKLAYRRGIIEAEEQKLMGIDGFQSMAVEKVIQDSIYRTAKSKMVLQTEANE